ncbi:MAG: hypothetical protein R2794_05195 [Chitinophagales bacterium]
MQEYSEFDINTGDIYSDLSLLEDILPREFFYEYEQKLEDLLYYKPLDNLKLPFNEPYTNEKIHENNFHFEHHKDPGHRPYTWFFIKESRLIDGYELVDFMNQYIVDRIEDEEFFDYFFAVRFRLVDFMKIRQFLFFQYNKNFKNDINAYEIFLHDLLLKYDDLLNDKKRGIVASKVIDEIKQGVKVISTSEVDKTDEAVLAVKVMAIHYLLKAIDPEMKRKDAAKTRFINMLTGKNPDNIYKMVQSPLSSRSGKLRIEEMEVIRKYFQELDLPGVIDIINMDFKA